MSDQTLLSPATQPTSQASDAGNNVLAALLFRMTARDEAALAELYDRTSSRLHALALRITRDRGLAEEVIEDAFFQVWRDAKKFDPQRGRVMTWLLTICRSRALDALRRADAADVVENPEELRLDPVVDLDDPAALLAQFTTNSQVQRALATLPPRERQVIALAFFRGNTHQEISDLWGIPLGSVKTLLSRAFSMLRVELESVK